MQLLLIIFYISLILVLISMAFRVFGTHVAIFKKKKELDKNVDLSHLYDLASPSQKSTAIAYGMEMQVTKGGTIILRSSEELEAIEKFKKKKKNKR